MARILNALARPWGLPPFLFILLLGLNRLIWRETIKFDTPRLLTPRNIATQFSGECLNAFFIALLISISVFVLIKLTKTLADVSFSELLGLSLKAQSFYLLAAPLALVFLNLDEHFSQQVVTNLAQLLKGFLPLTIFATLFFLLKKRLQGLSEIRVLSFVFAPYLLFIGILLATLVAIASLIALVITIAILK